MTDSDGILEDPRLLALESMWLRRLARSLCSDRALAEDLSQDALLAAWQAGDKVRGPLRPWLAGVLRRLTANRQRARIRSQRREAVAARNGTTGNGAVPGGTAPPTDEVVARASMHETVVGAVMKLEEPYRTAILLRYFDDLPLRTVAARLGLPTETVRTRIKRGIAVLRGRLDSMHDGDRKAWSMMLLPLLPTVTPAAVVAGGVGTGGVGTGGVGAGVVGPAVSSSMAGLAGITQVLIMTMTTKVKLAAVAVACGVVFAALWALQEPSGEGGLHDPTPDPGGGRLVAKGEGTAGAMAASASKDPSKRTEVPAPPVARSKLGSLLVKVIWEEDKQPAAGVLLRAWHIRGNAPSDRHSGTSDKNGTLRIENVKPGRFFVDIFRGDLEASDQKRVEVDAGKETQVQMIVPAGINLDGIVVDRGGNPVADATLIAAPRSGWSGGYAAPIAKSESNGRFHLRAIGVRCHIGARAKGYAPSPLHTIDSSKGRTVKVRLVLGGSGGGVHGRVLDPRGKPVRSAKIQVGEEAKVTWVRLPDGSPAIAPVPVCAMTDAEGHFVAEGLAPGRYPVAVRAEGLASWFGTVDVVPGGDTELLVHLLPAATVTGTVRNGNGKPLARVLVQTETGHAVYGNRWMRTGADGVYRLEDLAPGKMKILATGPQGRTKTELTVVAGQTMQWDPVLSAGLVLHGRVVDEQDKPVARIFLHASLVSPGQDSWYRYGQTDKEGRFALAGCPPGKDIRIRVSVQSLPYANKSIVAPPGQQDLVIRLQSLGEPSVHITGQVLDPDGKPAEQCRIHALARGQNIASKIITDSEAGRFKHGPYPPGEFRVSIEAKGYPRVRTGLKKLNKGDTWDLGVIRLETPGFLLVQLKGEASLLPKRAWFSLQNAAGESPGHGIRITDGQAQRSSPMAPGTYYLQVRDKSCLCTRHKFEIRAGQDTKLDVLLEKGTPVVLDFAIEVKGKLVVPPPGWVTVEITDAAGGRVLNAPAGYVRDDEKLRRLELAVRPGRYKVTANFSAFDASLRARAEATLTVGDKAAAAPLRIVLR